ncbi:MAG TPA: histidine kinase [Patescibacteria group bacterium]|nr:histidine kinase [Patescibacteria group bacterium]
MNTTRLKWISALLSAFIIGAFEFFRHHFLDIVSMEWGNLLVASLTGLLFVFYFHGVFALLENTTNRLQREQAETAILQERDRIARGLHDSVAQALFFMNIKASEIESALQHDQKSLAAVGELKAAIKMTDAEIRQHIFALQQVACPDIRLKDAFQKYLNVYREQSAMKVNFRVEGPVDSCFSPQEKSQLLRIFQELMLNIRKHAAASQATVYLTADKRHFSLVIRDNGKGFVTEEAASFASFGLKSLKEDVQALGAKWNLQSFPGIGTTITIYRER